MSKQSLIIKDELVCRDNGRFAFQEPWREVNNICKNNLKGDYKILFYNIEDCNKIPEVVKFVAFDWENLQVLVYREPEVKIFTFENYTSCLTRLKANEELFLSEGMRIQNENEYKRIYLFSEMEKPIKLDELKREGLVVKPGDYLNTCWGYDQTNIELFVVKRILGNSFLIIQEIAKQINPSDSITYNDVKVSPTIKKVDIPIKAHVSKDGYMRICEGSYKRGLSLTTLGEVHYETDSQFGH